MSGFMTKNLDLGEDVGMQYAKDKQNLEGNKLCEKNSSQFTMLKENAIKNAVESKMNPKKPLQKVIEIEINEHFKKCGIKHHFHRQHLSELINDQCNNLRLHEGLALAHVLNAFMVDFLNEDITYLGDFDIKILEEPDDEKRLHHLFELEKKNPQISRVYSSFPSCFCMQSPPQAQIINQQRLSFFQNNLTKLHEFYILENVLHFLFFPVSSISHLQRIDVINKFLSVFENYNNKLYFIKNNYYMSNISFFNNDALIYIDIPCSHRILTIKNKAIFEKLSFFENNNDVQITSPEESIYLLQKSKQFLENNTDFTTHQLKKLLNNFPQHLKQLIEIMN